MSNLVRFSDSDIDEIKSINKKAKNGELTYSSAIKHLENKEDILIKSNEVFIERRNKMVNHFKTMFDEMPQYVLNELYFINKCYKSNSFGYIYFLYNKHTGLTKIGQTTNLDTRIKTIRSTFRNYVGVDPDFELEAVMYTHSSFLNSIEKHLHNQLSDYKSFGEWYSLKECDCIGDILYSGDYLIIEDTAIILDCEEYLFYEKVEKNYNFTVEEVLDYHDIDYKKGLFSNSKNKLVDIYNTISKNNVNICSTYIDSGFNFKRMGIGKDGQKEVTIQEIKKENINREEIIKVINYLKNIK